MKNLLLILICTPGIITCAAMSAKELEQTRIKQIHADIPAHITGPQRAKMLDRMMNGEQYFVKKFDMYRAWMGQIVGYDSSSYRAINLTIRDYNTSAPSRAQGESLTTLPAWFFQVLSYPDTLVHFLDITDLKDLDNPTQERLAKVWVEAGRRLQDLKLPPKKSGCVVQ